MFRNVWGAKNVILLIKHYLAHQRARTTMASSTYPKPYKHKYMLGFFFLGSKELHDPMF